MGYLLMYWYSLFPILDHPLQVALNQPLQMQPSGPLVCVCVCDLGGGMADRQTNETSRLTDRPTGTFTQARRDFDELETIEAAPWRLFHFGVPEKRVNPLHPSKQIVGTKCSRGT